MTKLRQIAQLGAAILRQEAKTIEFDAANTHSIVSDMLATLADSNGVGLAAPQIYEPYRIVIIASRPTPRYPNAPEMQPTVMINPAFKPITQQKHSDWEGCLSIPGIRALVPRFIEIEVTFTNREGKSVSQRFEDFIARVFQHEYDHLEGKVFLDRVEDSLDIISEKEFNRQIIEQQK
jgi:peptide deformylase